MKSIKIILIFSIVAFSVSCKKDEGLNDADHKAMFIKTHGTLSEGADIKQTSDGGYILLGTTIGAVSTDIYLIKVDAFGNHQWSKTISGGSENLAASIEIMDDGGYAILGSTIDVEPSTSQNLNSTFLVLTNYLGEVIPNKSKVMNSGQFTPPENEIGYGLTLTQAGNFLIVSEKEVIKFNKPYKVGVMRLVDRNTFEILYSFERSFLPPSDADPGQDYGMRDVLINSQNDIVYTGYKSQLKTSNSGNRLLFTLFNIDLDEPGNSGVKHDLVFGEPGGNGNIVLENQAGEIVIAGFHSENGQKQFQVYNFGASYDLSPSVSWEYHGANTAIEEAFDMVEVDDGYVIAGYTEVNEDRQFYLVKINENGSSVIWEKNYGFISFDEAKGIIKTSDNGFAVIGTSSDERGNKVMTMLKLDANGNLK